MNTLQRAQWRQKKNLKKRARLTFNKKVTNIYRMLVRQEKAAAMKAFRAAAETLMNEAKAEHVEASKEEAQG